MATATLTATVTEVTYPSEPNIVANSIAGGRWSITNTHATVTVIASLDGITDVAQVPPLGTWIVQQPQESGMLWLRLDTADSVAVYASEELGFGFVAGNRFCSIGLVSGETIPIDAMATPVDIAPAAGDAWSAIAALNMTRSLTNGAITVPSTADTGYYLIAATLHFTKAGAAEACELTLLVDGGQVGPTVPFVASTADVAVTFPPRTLLLAGGQVVKFQVANTVSADDLVTGVGAVTLTPIGTV